MLSTNKPAQTSSRKLKRNILQKLHNRQLFGRLNANPREVPNRVFDRIPRRLVFQLASIVPEGLLSEGHIFLGFLRNSQHVVSYTKTEDLQSHVMFGYRFKLQFWRFWPGKELKFTRQIELFTEWEAIYFTLSQYMNDDSKVVVIGHPLDFLHNSKDDVVNVTVSAVPATFPCRKCETSCLEHNFFLSTYHPLHRVSVTDPLTMATVNDHVLINETSSLVCYHIQLLKDSDETDHLPSSSGSPIPDTEENLLQRVLTNASLSDFSKHDTNRNEKNLENSREREEDDAFGIEMESLQTSEDVIEVNEQTGNEKKSKKQEKSQKPLHSAFQIAEALENATNWTFPKSITSQTEMYFCEEIYSRAYGSVTVFNGSRDRPLFPHSERPYNVEEFIKVSEKQLDLDQCCSFIGLDFCHENQIQLIAVLNYDGKVLDFCPYSHQVTISLCIQIDTTGLSVSPERIASDKSVHVGYDLFAVLIWFVDTLNLQVRHLQYKELPRDFLKNSPDDEEELPESFKSFHKLLASLKAEKLGRKTYDLNPLVHHSVDLVSSKTCLSNRERTFCLTL